MGGQVWWLPVSDSTPFSGEGKLESTFGSSTCFSVRGVRTPASLFPSRDPVSVQIYYKLGLPTH